MRCCWPVAAAVAWLAVAVLVSDAAANGVADYALDPAVGVTAGRTGHAVSTMLAIARVLQPTAMAQRLPFPARP